LYAFKSGHRVEDIAATVTVRPEEVVVGDPQGKIKIGILITAITAGLAV